MTKETLERAKILDGDVAAINKMLDVLGKPILRISSGLTGVEFKLNELDATTHDELLATMKDVLTKRKSTMINELEEL